MPATKWATQVKGKLTLMAISIVKRLIAFSAAMIVATLAATSQNSSVADVKSRILAAAKEKKTMECDFVLTKRSQLLKEAAIMTGRMAYQKPDIIYWECVSPGKIVFTSDGKQATIEKDGQKSTIDLKSNRIYKRMKKMLGEGMGIESLVASDKLDAKVDDLTDRWRMTMTPNKKEIEQLASKIVLLVDKSDCTVKTVELTSKNGDFTTIELKNIKTNNQTDVLHPRQ